MCNPQLRRPLGISSLLLVVRVLFCHAQEPHISRAGSLNRDWTVPSAPLARVARDTATHVSHRRANIIGATTGAIIGGLGSAAYILIALAPHCVTALSTVSSSHCGQRTRIVALEVVTIAAGTTLGAVGGAWGARRIARWWGNRHQSPSS